VEGVLVSRFRGVRSFLVSDLSVLAISPNDGERSYYGSPTRVKSWLDDQRPSYVASFAQWIDEYVRRWLRDNIGAGVGSLDYCTSG
jgi:uncharacterized protein YfaQ (DUF2300 family)